MTMTSRATKHALTRVGAGFWQAARRTAGRDCKTGWSEAWWMQSIGLCWARRGRRPDKKKGLALRDARLQDACLGSFFAGKEAVTSFCLPGCRDNTTAVSAQSHRDGLPEHGRLRPSRKAEFSAARIWRCRSHRAPAVSLHHLPPDSHKAIPVLPQATHRPCRFAVRSGPARSSPRSRPLFALGHANQAPRHVGSLVSTKMPGPLARKVFGSSGSEEF